LKQALAALLLLAAALGCQAQEAQSLDALWAATVFDLDDKPVALRKYQGRPLVVNFWARWCGPCRDEIPDFVREYSRSRDKGVEMLGIAIEDNPESVRDFAKAYDMTYPVLLAKDRGLALLQALGDTKAGLPYTLVIDRRGNIVARKLGPMKKTDIEANFAATLK
jgi:peroxiredoxin